jgi:hypothetical protein
LVRSFIGGFGHVRYDPDVLPTPSFLPVRVIPGALNFPIPNIFRFLRSDVSGVGVAALADQAFNVCSR